MLTANYHTHTFRCTHAGTWTDEEYIGAAIEAGIRILGFADHCPWPADENFRLKPVAMDLAVLPEYYETIRALKEKYKDRITIHCGLECEYFMEYPEHLRMLHDTADYLILGEHYTKASDPAARYAGHYDTRTELREYTSCVVRAIESGLFAYVAHPDHCFSDYPRWDAYCEMAAVMICEAAQRKKIPLEYNISGYRKAAQGIFKGMGYPCDGFWMVAKKCGCDVIMGIDAHAPAHLLDEKNVARGLRKLRSFGITPMETLPGID